MLAFMLNPKRKRPKAKKARRRSTAWAKCMSAAGGNARIASGLLKKHRGCRLPKGLRKTLRSKLGPGYRSRTKSARIRASAERRARGARPRGVGSQTARLKALRAAQAAREREASISMALNPKRKKKHRKARRKSRAKIKHNRRKNVAKRAKRKHPHRRKAKMHRVKRGKTVRRRGRRTLKGGMLTRRRRKGKTRRSHRTKRGGWSNNPFGMGGNIISRIKGTLTSTDKLSAFAVGAAGGTISLGAGNFVAQKIREMTGVSALAKGEWGGIALDVAAQISAGIAISTLLPEKYRGPFVFGAGVMAVSDLVRTGMKQVVPKDYHQTLGLSGWIGVEDAKRGMRGISGAPTSLSGYLSVEDARRAMSGLRGRALAGVG